MANTVAVSLGLIVDGFNVALKSAEKQTEAFSKKAVSNFEFVEKSFAVMAGSLAASAFERFTSAVSNSFSHVIEEAMASEDAINNLNIALRSAGLYSEDTSKAMQDFAADLQKVTIYSDEAILKSSSLLLSLTNLDEKGIQAATKAAANLAATLNIDLSEATDMIAKAVNGNTIAFKKKGIVIQSADTDAQRLTNTLKALARQEGAAEAATNTYAGAIAKQKNQQSELLETVGKLITQNQFVKDSIDASTASYQRAGEWVSKNKKFIDDLTTSIIVTTGVIAAAAVGYYAVSTALGVTAIAAATGVGAFQALGIAAGVAWSVITAPVTLIVAGVAAIGFAVYEIVKHWDAVKSGAYNALAATLEFAAKGADVFSSKKAEALRAEAKEWREKAAAIRESTQATVDDQKSTPSDRNNKVAEELETLARINRNKAEARRINAAELQAIDEETNAAEQEAFVAHAQAMAEIRGEANAQTLAEVLASQQIILEEKHKHEQELLQLQIDTELNKANLENDAEQRKKAVQAVNDKAAIDRAKLLSKQQIEVTKQKNKDLETLSKQELDDRANTLNLFASLQNSSNKTMAAIGKAAALTQIAIDTPKAASAAFAYGTALGGPPLGFTFEAIAVAAEAAKAAQVVGVNFADGGIVPGSDMTGDRIRANVNSGEMFLNKRQQATLFAIANGASSSSGNGEQIDLLRQQNFLLAALLEKDTSIQIDGKEIISVVRTQTASGRRFD